VSFAVICLLAVALSTELAVAGGHRHGAAVPATHAHVRLGVPSRLYGPVRKPNGRQDRAISRVLSYAPYVSSGGRRGREVALTFDDGPGPYTHLVVHQLERLHVPATFFQVGQMMTAYPAQARAVRRRYPVGDHTLSHPPMARLWPAHQRAEILEQAARMRLFGDRFPRLFRPPYASFDGDTLRQLRGMRMLMVLWSVDSADYTRPGTRQIVRNVVSGVRPGAIVLMHDAGGPRSQTVAALPFIVRKLRRRGFRFVTVGRMMADAPPPRARRQRLPPGASRAQGPVPRHVARRAGVLRKTR